MAINTINPVTPVYSKAKPVVNEDCLECGSGNQNFYIPDTTGKTTELLAGLQIDITDLSTAEVDRFRVAYVPIVSLTVVLTVVAKASSIVQSEPILKGTIVDEANISWVYNKASVVSQQLTNNGGLSAPTLADADRSYDYTAQSINDDITFTIQGDDNLGNGPDSIAVDSEKITFGNYMVWGKGSSMIGQSLISLQNFFDTLVAGSNKVIDTDYTRNIYPLGGTNEKFFVMYPKAWGLATFKKGIFVGGMMRLKLSQTNGTLASELDGGDVELDTPLDNGNNGFSENFYVFESLFDNQNDPSTPIEIY